MSGFRADGPLCLLLLTYVRPLDEVDAHMKAHVDWIKQGFEAGVFLVAGRQEPRTGGVILARGQRPEAEALAATDPFVTSGVATVEIVQFNASFATPALAGLLA